MNKNNIGKEYSKKIFRKTKENDIEEPQQEEQELNFVDLFQTTFQEDSDKHEKDKIIEILFEHDDLRKIADISSNQLKDIAVLLTYSDAVDTPIVKKFCNHFLSLSLSKDRKSRQEVVEIYKPNPMYETGAGFYPSQDRPSRFERIKDRLGI